MTLPDGMRIAARMLRAHTLRSALALLGLSVGAAALVTTLALGAGAEALVTAQFEAVGSDILIVLSGSATSGGMRLGMGTRLTITQDDAATIQREISSVEIAAPSLRGNVQALHGGLNWATYMLGVTPEFLDARGWPLAAGRSIEPADVDGAGKVALVGQTLVQKLFGESDPLGETIRIGRVPFSVIGVLGGRGQDRSGQDWDDIVLVPLSTARTKILGVSPANARAVTAISIKVRPHEDIIRAEGEVRTLLRQRHRLQPDQPDDFWVTNQAEVLRAEQAASLTMRRLLAALAGIAMLIGGAGITNVMLVSVTQRTREIGLRMAVGARPRDIRLQFLVEAGALAVAGGALGVGLGIVSVQLMAALGDWPVTVGTASLLLAAGLAGAVGLVFGLYPAQRAARLNPIEALGRE
ncbi:MAG TPA: ABC transporter permease [Methylomirabilota bacterium]|nr:ABC transporter permease [Methylomirabilota bacterium]